MKQGSVAVMPGQSVAVGPVLGQVGHSGSGNWPHLHLGASPWRRWLPLWTLREGYTVQRAGALCGDVVVDELLDAVDVTAFRALLANPSGAPLSLEVACRCSVIAPAAACSVRDLVVRRRALVAPSQPPGVAEVCLAALGT